MGADVARRSFVFSPAMPAVRTRACEVKLAKGLLAPSRLLLGSCGLFGLYGLRRRFVLVKRLFSALARVATDRVVRVQHVRACAVEHVAVCDHTPLAKGRGSEGVEWIALAHQQ